MPGTPDPVLGSDALTFGIAAALAALVTVLPDVVRDRIRSPRRLAVGGGFAYAVLCIAAWAGARFVADAFIASMVADPVTLAGWIIGGTVVLAVQAGVPCYLYGQWRFVAPLAALCGATLLVLYAFLRVRGESDPLALYALFFGPMVIAATPVLGVAEAGVRRLVARMS
jgi:hypothetical protein